MLKAALIGNPNAGKTTLFNALTGARQRVANYPGTTVERKEGGFQALGEDVALIDLPGLYDLTPLSPDEAVARGALIKERPDVIVQVLDASNLARGLYLTLELLALETPLVLCLNMLDVAEAKGAHVDPRALSKLLGVPVAEAIASKGVGMEALKRAILETAREGRAPRARVAYGEPLDFALKTLQSTLEAAPSLESDFPASYLALKLLEGDELLVKAIQDGAGYAPLEAAFQAIQERIGQNTDMMLKQRRYEKASQIAKSVTLLHPKPAQEAAGDKLDRLLLNPQVGIPAFLVMLFGVFALTFLLGNPLAEGIERIIGALGAWTLGVLGTASPLLASFLVDGVLAGVGAVLTFLPQIAILFMALVAMEDSGAMARAAYLLEGWMSKLGLHGKSVIPMVLGFGCAVPAIMATRIVESRKERLITMFVLPLFSCSARFPIYVLIVAAFFPKPLQPLALFGAYILGVALAFLIAVLLKWAFDKGEEGFFLLEIPPYRMPSKKTLLFFTWQRVSQFLKRAGTIIFAFSVLMWAMSRFPSPPASELVAVPEGMRPAYRLGYSFTGRLAKGIEPILEPIGFDGRIGMALIGATLAREIFISQLGIVYALDAPEGASPSLADRLQKDYGPLTGVCLLLYFLIASPCVSASSVMAKESGSTMLAFLQAGFLFALGYAAVFLAYRIGLMLGA
jgi:ferrous iron transport protein B